ncbi:hypothetical protein ZEAMMB73_Zm00001d042819 [Zea mays]|jgi:hypothetical protein|uniref:Uncharacterized protein n=1 Tax=Zea mays TaxID=4577 RepID=A0A1D6N6Y8_MAIZE|nr:hypothetical protein ZEAMMB73_Zm00001d042819 [Zea mays]
MQLCAATPERTPWFVPTPEWGAGAAAFPQTPKRSPRFAATPDWGTGFMMPPDATAVPRTPERWPALPRTPEYAPAPRREQARWGGESKAEAPALYESGAESLRPAFLPTVAFALCFSLALRGSAQRANHRLAEKEIVVVLSSASVVLVDSSVAVVD